MKTLTTSLSYKELKVIIKNYEKEIWGHKQDKLSYYQVQEELEDDFLEQNYIDLDNNKISKLRWELLEDNIVKIEKDITRVITQINLLRLSIWECQVLMKGKEKRGKVNSYWKNEK